MLRFLRRSSSPSPKDGGLDDACHRCGNAISAQERAVEAASIVGEPQRSIFHEACAPSPDNLRWRRLREAPLWELRTGEPGD
jgi:hypothetical protein